MENDVCITCGITLPGIDSREEERARHYNYEDNPDVHPFVGTEA